MTPKLVSKYLIKSSIVDLSSPRTISTTLFAMTSERIFVAEDGEFVSDHVFEYALNEFEGERKAMSPLPLGGRVRHSPKPSSRHQQLHQEVRLQMASMNRQRVNDTVYFRCLELGRSAIVSPPE